VFKKILIANRGEIAVRVIRAAWDLDIETVAVYSTVDRTALHVRMADEAYCIGPPPARQSYLDMDKLIEVAKAAGAEAIHPGYGFLSENADFSERCTASGLVFIGPPASAMRLLGDKVSARAAMKSAGVPMLPGTDAFDGTDAEAAAIADAIGYPVIVKAAAGGGGKGMRLVQKAADLSRALDSARSEARTAFGNDTIYMEKYLVRPRHVEVQILFDQYGYGVALGERECSIQRRHQKILEETPSPVVDAAARRQLVDWGVRAGRAAGYVNAGTVEFLRGDDGSFYFMEVNARLQVEHPVTEEVYGHDLVKAQIRIAAGEPLSWGQDELIPTGHAIEVRICAEDPERNFVPSPGLINLVRIPAGPGVRNDHGAAPNYAIPVEYDPLVGKLIAHGDTRDEAIRRLRRALDEYRLDGLTTNIPFLRRLLEHPAFVAGQLHTGFIEEHSADLFHAKDPLLDEIALLAASIHAYRTQGENALRQDTGAASSQRSNWVRLGRGRGWGGGR
jgi:acetyl-CoA carboxylase, biotin carboxylase subunit